MSEQEVQLSTTGRTSEEENVSAAWLDSTEFFRQVWEITSDAMAVSDPEGNVLDANPAYLHLYGYSLEQVKGHNFTIIFPEEARAAAAEQYKVIFASEMPPPTFESVVRRADGSERIVEASATFLTQNGRRVGMLSTIRDITARKRIEADLRFSQERLRLTMESIADFAIITLDLAGRVTGWNAGAEVTFGFKEDEILGQSAEIIFTPEDRANGVPAQEMEQARLTGRAADERWHLRKDGTRFYVSGVMSPLQAGTLIGYVKVARDLTQRKQMEEEVRQLNSSLEEMVQSRTQQVRDLVMQLTMSEQAERRRISLILHDDLQQRLYSLNFQLVTLRYSVNDELAKENPKNKENNVANLDAITQQFAEIDETVRKAVQVTRSLSAELSPPILHDTGLVEALRWLASHMAQQHGLAVTVRAVDDIEVSSEDMRVMLFQIVRELLFNVVKHAQVSTATIELAQTQGELRITVEDKGRGFARIMQAGSVASESENKPQTSQGLLRSRQRLQLIGGRLQVESEQGQGARITLYIPLPAGN